MSGRLASEDGWEGEILSTDFSFAFTPASGVYDQRGKDLSIPVAQAGELLITSGSIVACDPYWLNAAPQEYTTKVPLGRFPVFVSIAEFASPHQQRVACAMLRFNVVGAVRWEMAVVAGQEVSTLEPGQLFCYGVDAGTGCFVDVDVVTWLIEQAGVRDLEQWRGLPESMGNMPGIGAAMVDEVFDYFETEVAPRLDEMYTAAAVAAEVILNDGTGSNLVFFSSGWGDGCYASYFGYAADGSLACLVTDFEVLLGAHL